MRTTGTTFKNLVIDHLTENGMFESDAEKVFEDIVNNESEMKGRWGDSVDGYPDAMKAGILFITKIAALKWIDTNCPKAWYRGMFE